MSFTMLRKPLFHYADDTVCYKRGTNISVLNNLMDRATSEFKYWCDLNRLTLNLKKSKIMLFSNTNYKTTLRLKGMISIKSNGQKMDTTPEYRYLGLILDDKLRFHSHIKMIRQRVSYRLLF